MPAAKVTQRPMKSEIHARRMETVEECLNVAIYMMRHRKPDDSLSIAQNFISGPVNKKTSNTHKVPLDFTREFLQSCFILNELLGSIIFWKVLE